MAKVFASLRDTPSGVSRSSLHRILKAHHPFKIELAHELNEDDYVALAVLRMNKQKIKQ